MREIHPCYPQNPYAVSKFAMGQTALQLGQKENLQLIHVRPFNHFGPGQKEGFVISDFSAQIARMEAGLSPPVIKVGNLKVYRDFTDVRDIVKAYALLAEKEISTGIYNICSGIGRNIHDILKRLLEQSQINIEIQQDSARFRPVDIPQFCGSAEKIQSAVNWQPETSFEESLSHTLHYWRTKINQNL